MSKSRTKTNSKKEYKKGPWYGAKEFSNKELLEIMDHWDNKRADENFVYDPKEPLDEYEGPLSFDFANEKGSDVMKSKGVRYIKALFTALDGSIRPLAGKSAISRTASRMKAEVEEDDNGEPKSTYPKKVNFVTKAYITDFDDEKKVASQVRQLTIDAIDKYFPDMENGPDKDAMIKKQIVLKKREAQNWEIMKWLDEEWRMYINSYAMGDLIDFPSDAVHKTCLQRFRDYKSTNPDDVRDYPQYRKTKKIPLDDWIIRNKISGNGNTGEMWCKFFDLTKPSKPGKNGKRLHSQVKIKDPETGKIDNLKTYSVKDFVTFDSPHFDNWEIQLCTHAKGSSMHRCVKKMYVKRAAPRESTDEVEIDDDYAEAMEGMIGSFETIEESKSNQVANNEESNSDDDDDSDNEYSNKAQLDGCVDDADDVPL